jgi:hypothetical protein
VKRSRIPFSIKIALNALGDNDEGRVGSKVLMFTDSGVGRIDRYGKGE